MSNQEFNAEVNRDIKALVEQGSAAANAKVLCPVKLGINYKSELISLTITLPDGRDIDFHPGIVHHVAAAIAARAAAGVVKLGIGEAEFTADATPSADGW